MGDHNRKKELYNKVDQIRKELGINMNSYPIDMVDFCARKGLAAVEAIPFKSPQTKGMAVPSYQNGEKDIILLNSSLGKRERSFTCGHEIVHLTLHRCKVLQFFSFEQVMRKQNPYLEWQANEGSAELHVPYQLLLPKLKAAFPYLKSLQDIQCLKASLAEDFQVADEVIYYRLDSLKYEIAQYLTGTSLENIVFMTRTKQKEAGILVKSLNDVGKELQKNPPLSAGTEKDGHHQQG